MGDTFASANLKKNLPLLVSTAQWLRVNSCDAKITGAGTNYLGDML
jgi:hypothetical protein